MVKNPMHKKAAMLAAAALLGATTLATVSTLVAAAPAAYAAQKAPSREELATGTWDVDKLHTDIGFAITHMGVSKVRGHFDEFEGQVVADGKKPERSSVSFTIKTASVNTGNSKRDEHLRNADFFDVEKYPEITFKSTSVQRKGKNGFVARGPLTMHGVTKVVELPFTVSGPLKGPGGLHAGVETSLVINRQDYGLTWSRLTEGVAMVGNEVTINISLELIKKGAQQTAAL